MIWWINSGDWNYTFCHIRYVEEQKIKIKEVTGTNQNKWNAHEVGKATKLLLFHHLYCGTMLKHEPFLHHFSFLFFFFFFPCCFLSYGSCFLVAVLFYPLADWCRLYVFPPEPRQPTHNHLLISTPALFIPSSLSSYILRNRSNVSVSCLHLCLLLTRKQPSTSFKHTEGHQAAHTSSWIGAFLWDDYTFVFFSSSSFV